MVPARRDRLRGQHVGDRLLERGRDIGDRHGSPASRWPRPSGRPRSSDRRRRSRASRHRALAAREGDRAAVTDARDRGRSGGPPGNGRPSTRATLSKASPAASSTVAPSDSTGPRHVRDQQQRRVAARHEQRDETAAAAAPCSSWSTATCAARWLTPYSGLPSDSAYALAAATPTSSAPASRGRRSPRSRRRQPQASRPPGSSARSTDRGTIASRWARLATSGTTPPNRACSSTLEAIASREQLAPAHQADAGLVARGLDAENERASHRAPPAEAAPSAGFAGPGGIGVTGSWRPRRITIASIPDGW